MNATARRESHHVLPAMRTRPSSCSINSLTSRCRSTLASRCSASSPSPSSNLATIGFRRHEHPTSHLSKTGEEWGVALRRGFVADGIADSTGFKGLRSTVYQRFGFRARHEIASQDRRSASHDLGSPGVEQSAWVAQVPFLVRPLPADGDPVELLQLAQDLGGGGRRHLGPLRINIG